MMNNVLLRNKAKTKTKQNKKNIYRKCSHILNIKSIHLTQSISQQNVTMVLDDTNNYLTT